MRHNPNKKIDRNVLRWICDAEIYRCKNLVYVRTLKCASTYYKEEFIANGWVRDSWKNINWDYDHVFSFIMDPLVRRIKGLAQYIVMYPGAINLLNQDEIFWQRLISLDMHSVPYYLTYQDRVRKIDWIPIDSPNFSSEELVIKLCNFYDVKIDLSYQRKNLSDSTQQEICQKIEKLTGNGSAEMYLCLEPDMFLYADVCTGITPYADSWKSITWLKQK